jgi:ribosomal protein S18 acetylase RimI-like enzyme
MPLHRLHTVDDPLLLPWLELYETAFPAHERILIAHILRSLQPLGSDDNARLLALLDDAGQLAGLIMFQLYPQMDIGFLYYLATRPELRGQGQGAAFYQKAVDSLFREVSWLVFEVEKPELAEDEAHRQLAERRIRFYQRQGARLLQGIAYLQDVGPHCPPTPMHLMFQARPGVPLEPQAAFDAVAPLLGENLAQTGTLTWASSNNVG